MNSRMARLSRQFASPKNDLRFPNNDTNITVGITNASRKQTGDSHRAKINVSQTCLVSLCVPRFLPGRRPGRHFSVRSRCRIWEAHRPGEAPIRLPRPIKLRFQTCLFPFSYWNTIFFCVGRRPAAIGLRKSLPGMARKTIREKAFLSTMRGLLRRLTASARHWVHGIAGRPPPLFRLQIQYVQTLICIWDSDIRTGAFFPSYFSYSFITINTDLYISRLAVCLPIGEPLC